MKIKNEIFEIRGARINGANPLPAFRKRKFNVSNTSPDFPEYLKEGLAHLSKPLPYLVQDRYSRKREPMKLKSFVLENEYLIARFLPEYGGRLHSLYDKKQKRDLLFTNPVIQPGNLAIRNAWLSGGIEWNIGNFGHTYTTCSTVYSAILTAPDGNEFLRIYEFERNKSIFWQVDFHLPDGSPYLISHVKMINPFNRNTTTYWWSNIAVPTDEHTRVLASNRSIISFVKDGMQYDTLPKVSAFENTDVTYPNNAPYAFDYFIQKNEDGESTWEAAAYDDGVVFFERSTAPLYYKKLFCWGNTDSGRHWQEFLSDGPGTGYYAELQAGIAPSQLHDKLLPKNSKYEWTQVFGGMKLDEKNLFGDYNAACDYFDSALNSLLTADGINALNEKLLPLAEIPVKEENIITRGTGFGALEIMRMEIDKDGTAPTSMLFPADNISGEEEAFLTLLKTGRLPKTDPREIPVSYMTSPKWIKRLRAAAEKEDASWNELLHYGIAVYEYQNTEVYLNESFDERESAEQTRIATEAFKASLSRKQNAWALRNLAILASDNDDKVAAEEYYDKALLIEGVFDDYALASEYLDFLVKAEKFEKAYRIFETLPEDLKARDRIRITVSKAAIKTRQFAFVEEFLNEEHYDIQEGETTPTDVWFEYSAIKLMEKDGVKDPDRDTFNEYIDRAWDECPPDPKIDFRMVKAKNKKYRI